MFYKQGTAGYKLAM